MNTKIFSIFLASLFVGQTAFAQGSTWRTYYESPISTSETRKWNVAAINVSILPTARLSGSSANIVWHGEGKGQTSDRVRDIVAVATKLGAQKLRGRREVDLNMVIYDFKSPTPSVRRSKRTDIGVHHINFSIEIRDSKTQALILRPTIIEADLEALTGDFAKAFEAQRQGQKARVTQHLASVVQGFLGQGPDPRRRFTRYAR